jgi:acylphosphatase
MPQEKMERRAYHVYGTVQGVGFRYRARAAAELLSLSGWVENLDDASVAMEAQGTPEALDRFVESICRGSAYIEITKIVTENVPVLAKEYGFSTKGW